MRKRMSAYKDMKIFREVEPSRRETVIKIRGRYETIKNGVSLEKNDYLCVIIFEISDERSEI